jgi:hypothetical protein
MPLAVAILSSTIGLAAVCAVGWVAWRVWRSRSR